MPGFQDKDAPTVDVQKAALSLTEAGGSSLNPYSKLRALAEQAQSGVKDVLKDRLDAVKALLHPLSSASTDKPDANKPPPQPAVANPPRFASSPDPKSRVNIGATRSLISELVNKLALKNKAPKAAPESLNPMYYSGNGGFSLRSLASSKAVLQCVRQLDEKNVNLHMEVRAQPKFLFRYLFLCFDI